MANKSTKKNKTEVKKVEVKAVETIEAPVKTDVEQTIVKEEVAKIVEKKVEVHTPEFFLGEQVLVSKTPNARGYDLGVIVGAHAMRVNPSKFTYIVQIEGFDLKNDIKKSTMFRTFWQITNSSDIIKL